LLAPHILGDLANEPRRRKELQAHLLCCQDCTQTYDGFKETIGFVLEHKAEFARAFEKARAREREGTVSAKSVSNEPIASIEKPDRYYKPKMTVEEGWNDLCRRCPDLAETTEKPKSLQLFLRVGAVAACLVIGVFTWLTFLHYSKSQTLSQTSSSGRVASALKPSVKVELVTNTGNIPVPSGQQITSSGQLKTLLINSKHQMIMNTNTVLVVEPLIENDSIGCLVKLASGQIYTHVEHDGNPFVVDTANGKAVITGTTFDVKATNDSTTLVVSEGTVQFESESGVVKVAAGQISKITGESAPLIPLSCDTAELTAWATGYKAGPALAKTKLNFDPWDLPLSFGEKPIVLAETDYHQWVEQKREWFKTNFPWIFELKDALAREGIEVDYPELLIKSGNVWQFVCLQKFPARFSVPDFESLLKAASSYGFDKEWLLKNVPTAKHVQNKSLLLQNPTGLAVFEQLLKYATGKAEAPSSYYSADACKYLAETRSLIWFAVRGGRYDLTDKNRTELLAVLQEEVTTALNYQNSVLQPQDDLRPFCDDKYQEQIDNIRWISLIAEYEETLDEYVSPMSLMLRSCH